jgi:hypothetical protein
MLQWINGINITMNIFFFIPSAVLRALREEFQENALYHYFSMIILFL